MKITSITSPHNCGHFEATTDEGEIIRGHVDDLKGDMSGQSMELREIAKSLQGQNLENASDLKAHIEGKEIGVFDREAIKAEAVAEATVKGEVKP
jgi:hypothetical protein